MSHFDNGTLYCSFCGEAQQDVERLITGPNVNICNNCIKTCLDLINEDNDSKNKDSENQHTANNKNVLLSSPKKIKQFLDNYIIGQDYAKKTLAVAVYNHYKRLKYIDSEGNEKNDDVEISKSNVLLIGPTGCGKTLLAQTLAKLLNVPFAIADATTLTEAGYVGDDVENVLQRLIQNADGDVERAQRGIIYLDEIDKIGRKSENPSITRDVSGEGVQQALLKIIEGTTASVNKEGDRKHPTSERYTIDTRNILFICGGAFEGIDKIIARRCCEGAAGFFADVRSKTNEESLSQLMKKVKSDDLVKFGIIPELIGRLPIVAVLDKLTEEDLINILTQPKNAIVRQYKKLFHMDNVELNFENDALKLIAEKSLKRKSGARGLRTIVEKILLDTMYDIPDGKWKKVNVVQKNGDLYVEKQNGKLQETIKVSKSINDKDIAKQKGSKTLESILNDEKKQEILLEEA